MAQIEGTPDNIDMTDKAVSHVNYNDMAAGDYEEDVIHSVSYDMAEFTANTPFVVESVSFSYKRIGKNSILYYK